MDHKEQPSLPSHKQICDALIKIWEREIRLVESGLGFDVSYHKEIVNHYKKILNQLN